MHGSNYCISLGLDASSAVTQDLQEPDPTTIEMITFDIMYYLYELSEISWPLVLSFRCGTEQEPLTQTHRSYSVCSR